MDKNFPLALTFDDVLLRPGYAGFFRSQVDLKVKLTKKITLETPIISSPMDTVTESKLAIAMAENGGLGIIHRNLTIDEQVREVAKVKKKNLIVGAAVGSSAGYKGRVRALIGASVDIVVVDSAHGNSKQVTNAVKYIKSRYKTSVMAGNVATAEGARKLIAVGTDILRVGMGPGAICSTRVVSGMGMPQLTAILATSDAAKKHDVPVIADGGINYSGDITKALAAGASAVMLGRLLAATNESSGKSVVLSAIDVPRRFKSIINGSKQYRFKRYRGMGSVAAMKDGLKISSEDEFHGKNYTSDVLIAEGVEGMIPQTGSVADTLAQLKGGVVSGMYYVGCKTISELWKKSKFVRISQASLNESHPHDLFITDSGTSYP